MVDTAQVDAPDVSAGFGIEARDQAPWCALGGVRSEDRGHPDADRARVGKSGRGAERGGEPQPRLSARHEVDQAESVAAIVVERIAPAVGIDAWHGPTCTTPIP